MDIEVAYKLVDAKFDSAPSFDCNRCVCVVNKKAMNHSSNASNCCWQSTTSSMPRAARAAEYDRTSNFGERLSYYNPISDAVTEEASSLLRYND